MKIAMYHNLQDGGGLRYLTSIIQQLSKLGMKMDIYTHQKQVISMVNKTYYYPLSTTNNIFQYVKQVVCETDTTELHMANKIIDGKYNYIFIFPCHLQQCPNIIKFLPKNITYYFYLENLREFYEKTSFDYYNFNKIISRIIKLPIKIQDHLNCSTTRKIITDSYYSNYQLRKNYHKESYVIQPGLTNTIPKKIKIINNHKSLSFGLLTMLKGHHISAEINQKIKIYGSKSHEDITKHIDKNTYINTNLIDEQKKLKLYKTHTFYFSNQINEPFGLTTLEATMNHSIIIGRNEGGTCEIVSNGNNGYLYNTNNIKLATKLFNKLDSKKTIYLNKIAEINWKNTTNKILDIIKYV